MLLTWQRRARECPLNNIKKGFKNMSRITNTEKEEANPQWLFGGNPSAIEAQESRGQGELVNSTQLPSQITGKEILEKAGVKFGKPLEDDPLFCDAELPEGWKKERTDHSLWSKLVDADGKERATIFYKAASYDRDAFMSATKD